MWQSSLLAAMADRRQALKTFFGAGAAVALAGCAPAEKPAAPGPSAKRVPVNFKDPAENLRAFIKLTGDLDPTVETTGWFGGTVFAVTTPDKPLMPLYGVEGFGVLRVEAQSDGSYRMFNREIAFYKDPRTQQFIDEWTNPFTGETVEVKPIHNLVVNAEIAPVMKMDFDGTMVEVPFSPPWELQGDKAFSLFEVHTAFPSPMQPDKWPRESAGTTLRISEMFHRFTTLAELEDPDRTACDYVGTWTRIGPWMPWMLQGQAPGHLFYRTMMNRTGTPERLPKALRERTEKGYPEYFQAPGPETWGSPNDSSYSVYMRENQPKPAKP
ncbi:MAG: DUF1838 domain-containing protein [Gammaproteobacteria bacterium]|nr:DUF1838 domain-containing protein [Gammaproteobacteria bacterium]